ncbi:MAG TPA: TetR/AcrR family transcriptional regulator [Anaerolineales bacterium]
MQKFKKPPQNRRQRRVAARRAEILNAATHLFAEKGFHRTTTRDIAAAADVSEGTLYNYFENKDDILFGIMSRLTESQDLNTSLAQALPDDARGFLYDTLIQRKQFVDQNSDMLQSVLSEILVNPELRQRYYRELILPSIELLEAHLQVRQDQGQIRPLNIPMSVRFLVALTNGLFFLDVLGDPLVQSQWDELSQLITSIFFDGVDPRP